MNDKKIENVFLQSQTRFFLLCLLQTLRHGSSPFISNIDQQTMFLDTLVKMFHGGDLPVLIKHIDSSDKRSLLFKTLVQLRYVSRDMCKFVDVQCMEIIFGSFWIKADNKIYKYLSEAVGLCQLHSHFLLSLKHPFCNVNPMDYTLLRRLVGNFKMSVSGVSTHSIWKHAADIPLLENFANNFFSKEYLHKMCGPGRSFYHETLSEQWRKGNVPCEFLFAYWRKFLIVLGTKASILNIQPNKGNGSGLGHHMFCTHCCAWTTETKNHHNCNGQNENADVQLDFKQQLIIKRECLRLEVLDNDRNIGFALMCLSDMKSLHTMCSTFDTIKSRLDFAQKQENYELVGVLAKKLSKLAPKKRLLEYKYHLQRKRPTLH